MDCTTSDRQLLHERLLVDVSAWMMSGQRFAKHSIAPAYDNHWMGVRFWPKLNLGVRAELAQQLTSAFLANEGWIVHAQAAKGTGVDLVGRQTRDPFSCCAPRRIKVRLRPRGDNCVAEFRFGLGLVQATILGIISTAPSIALGLAYALHGTRPLPVFAAVVCSALVLMYWQSRPTCDELLLKYAAMVHTKAGSLPRYQTVGIQLHPNPALFIVVFLITVSGKRTANPC